MTIGKTCLQPQSFNIRNSTRYGSCFIARAGLSVGGWAHGGKEKECKVFPAEGREV